MSNDVAASMGQDFSNTPGAMHRGFLRPGPVPHGAFTRNIGDFFK